MKRYVILASLITFQTQAQAQVQAQPQATDFTQQWNLIADHSWASGYRAEDVRSAHRGLLTWDMQYQLNSQWAFQGNLKAFRGRNGERLIGNREGISNIDAEVFSKVYEAFVVYRPDEQQRIKCGQVDANLEFAMIPSGGNFISPPLGITPTAIALPTYYDPALSCSYFYEPELGWQAAFGVFAGRDAHSFAEQFYIAEARYVTERSRWSFGYWRHNGQWEHVTQPKLEPASGWYVNGEFQQGPLTFFTVWSGLVDDVDILHQHRMLGVTYQHERAESGLVLSQVTAAGQEDEWMVEGYHQWSLLEQVVIQPVVQWVHYQQPDKPASIVWTLRWIWTFE